MSEPTQAAIDERAQAKARVLSVVERLGRATLAMVMDQMRSNGPRVVALLDELIREGKIHKAGASYVSFR